MIITISILLHITNVFTSTSTDTDTWKHSTVCISVWRYLEALYHEHLSNTND